ncbi:uncharacterized protein [Bos taurus]|uniref:uncharacterized protein n=1 Tax=Bos taurus TaxID=9913 RepID=UPI0028CB83A7|nr:uncharacterized protein LOC101906734 [Bos taurus]
MTEDLSNNRAEGATSPDEQNNSNKKQAGHILDLNGFGGCCSKIGPSRHGYEEYGATLSRKNTRREKWGQLSHKAEPRRSQALVLLVAGRRARGWRRSLPGAAAAAAAAGSWRPWLRRPQAAALGNAGGSVPPGPAALAAAAAAPSLGPRVTWPGRRASLQGLRNPLPALPAPLQRAPRARLLTPHTPAPEPRLASGAHPSRKSRSSASDRRHSGCMPAARSLGETFWCLLYRHAAGRGELPKMRDEHKRRQPSSSQGELYHHSPAMLYLDPDFQIPEL